MILYKFTDAGMRRKYGKCCINTYATEKFFSCTRNQRGSEGEANFSINGFLSGGPTAALSHGGGIFTDDMPPAGLGTLAFVNAEGAINCLSQTY
jgi:hypothetical protein